jgi:hypothetical protein
MLRIRNWSELFETSETRKYKKLTWVKIINHTDGFGHRRLISGHPNGAAHFGAWVGIILVASRCAPRGTLISDNGVPLTAEDLGLMSGLNLPFEEAIPRLIELDWLEHCDSPGTPADFPGTPGIDKTRSEETRSEQTTLEEYPSCPSSADGRLFNSSPDPSADDSQPLPNQQAAWFADWWPKYWRHVGKVHAWKAFQAKVKERTMFDAVMRATELQRPGMMKREEDHRPHPSTWLNGERWNDVVGSQEDEAGLLERIKASLAGDSAPGRVC